ncbi:MAG: hypothetical protein SNJ75_05955 [Gemmataceae bacterium]
MAAKADKDALKKNLFWILLGVFLVGWLLTMIFVLLASDENPKKNWEAAKAKIGGVRDPKNESFYAPWNKYKQEASAHKDKVWEAGWLKQKEMYTWPINMVNKPNYPSDKLGNNDSDDLERRTSFRNDEYKTQFAGLDQLVNPVTFSPSFEAVFPMQVWNKNTAPTREEIWLAQEDFWVRREMLYIVLDALNKVAQFQNITAQRVDPKAKLPNGVEARRVYRNANWELDLLFVKNKERPGLFISGESTIKNVNRTQKTQFLASRTSPPGAPGVPFRFYHPGGASRVIRIAGEPLAYEQVAKLGVDYDLSPVNVQAALAGKDPRFALEVQQVLEWDTSPIRQIDALEIALHCHRTVTWGLKINEELKNLDPLPEKPEGSDATSPAPGGSPAAGGMSMPGGAPVAGGPGGVPGNAPGAAPAAADLTPVTAIPRHRYMHITKQCRHLPIGMRVVIDQSHIHDFLGAVCNSPLRIQITQVSFHHVPTPSRPGNAGGSGTTPGSYPPGSYPPGGGPDSGNDEEDRIRPGAPSGVRPPPFPMPGRPLTGSYPGGAGWRPGDDYAGSGFGGSGSVTRPTETISIVQDNAKLVELTVYGIATLYERYPPAAPKESSNP